MSQRATQQWYWNKFSFFSTSPNKSMEYRIRHDWIIVIIWLLMMIMTISISSTSSNRYGLINCYIIKLFAIQLKHVSFENSWLSILAAHDGWVQVKHWTKVNAPNESRGDYFPCHKHVLFLPQAIIYINTFISLNVFTYNFYAFSLTFHVQKCSTCSP